MPSTRVRPASRISHVAGQYTNLSPHRDHLCGERLVVPEGNLTDLPDAKRSSAVSKRQYILKISNYNYKDANKRDADLDELSREAAQLPDTYITESFIGVNEAINGGYADIGASFGMGMASR
ncbi:MAG: hypothetical protein JKY83_04665 [Rhizobiaceae bacterium]|nr:hypothetical protein [Rhizobiaceae bacterium]